MRWVVPELGLPTSPLTLSAQAERRTDNDNGPNGEYMKSRYLAHPACAGRADGARAALPARAAIPSNRLQHVLTGALAARQGALLRYRSGARTSTPRRLLAAVQLIFYDTSRTRRRCASTPKLLEIDRSTSYLSYATNQIAPACRS